MNNYLSENIKKIRKDNNLSQEQLAEELGVSRQAISKWESGVAYPEMDKLIQLCNKFELNIDDLLHGDIREVKSEEKTKKDFNKVIDSFLNFITDSIDLFVNMTFKSKIKCIFEQCVIAILLCMAVVIVGGILESAVSGLIYLLPDKLSLVVFRVLRSAYYIFALVLSVGIFIHIFKTRYLDYYKKVNKKEEKEEIKIEENTSNENTNIEIDNSNSKIVIRDPKHSEYGFIKLIFKVFIFGVKIFASFILLFVACGLVSLFIGFVLSFLLYKTGLLFIGLLVSCIACGIIGVDILLILLNFIFNRKNDKKKMIWSFIISLILMGVGIGLIISGSMKFDLIEETKYTNNYKTEKLVIDMDDKLYIHNNVTYVEKNIKNVEIEYSVNKVCSMDYSREHLDGLSLYSNCSNPMLIIRQFVDNVNDKKIVFPTSDIINITVYASKDNIKTMENNHKKFISTYDFE